jgi:hypothetical protein
MYDAMHAVSNGTVPELSGGSSARGDEGYARPKEPFLRRAAVRMGWLLLFVVRNVSASATPIDLTYGGSRMVISRLVTEDDCLPSRQNFSSYAKCPDLRPRIMAELRRLETSREALGRNRGKGTKSACEHSHACYSMFT